VIDTPESPRERETAVMLAVAQMINDDRGAAHYVGRQAGPSPLGG